jgi:hypothetical protein
MTLSFDSEICVPRIALAVSFHICKYTMVVTSVLKCDLALFGKMLGGDPATPKIQAPDI